MSWFSELDSDEEEPEGVTRKARVAEHSDDDDESTQLYSPPVATTTRHRTRPRPIHTEELETDLHSIVIYSPVGSEPVTPTRAAAIRERRRLREEQEQAEATTTTQEPPVVSLDSVSAPTHILAEYYNEIRYTSLWEEGFRSADTFTLRLCKELSEANTKIHALDSILRDTNLLYLTAAFSIKEAGAKLVLRRPMRFVFDTFYSNSYLYPLLQFSMWWSWRVWYQTMFVISGMCDTKTFDWVPSAQDDVVLRHACTPDDSVKALFQSSSILMTVDKHFIGDWPSHVESYVMSDDIHAKVDAAFLPLLLRSNLAVCQALFLLLSDGDDVCSSHSVADQYASQHIQGYYQSWKTLESIASHPSVVSKLAYFDKAVLWMKRLYYRAIARFAKVYHQFHIEQWAWEHVVSVKYGIPKGDVDAKQALVECTRVCELVCRTAWKPDNYWNERFTKPACLSHQSPDFACIHCEPIDRSLLPRMNFR